MAFLVSIIIPTFNRAHLIGETLDSVIAQTYQQWECIVVDDGSIDYTEELMEFYCGKDSRISFHHRPQDRIKGANACRNYGFELSKGEYINWFDDDDLMDRDKLKIQVKVLEKSNYNYSVCQTLVFDQHVNNIIGLRHERITSNYPFHDYLMLKIVWMTPSALWKREFLNNLNYLFDETLQAAQEWEFHCRALANCSDYYVEDKPLVLIRKHPESLTYSSDNKNRVWNYFLARLKIYKNSDLILDWQSRKYLQDYLLRNFKYFTKSSRFKISIQALFLYIYTERGFKVKVKIFASLSIVSYLLFKKGYLFLKRVNYIG